MGQIAILLSLLACLFAMLACLAAGHTFNKLSEVEKQFYKLSKFVQENKLSDRFGGIN